MKGKDCENPLFKILQMQQMDPQKLERMTMIRSIEMNKKYTEMCRQTIKDLEDNCNPKDRLEAGVAIEFIVNYMAISIEGWRKWCNLKGMNILTDEEFKELVPKLTKLAVKWIKADKKITEAKTKEMEEELKEFDAKAPKTAQKKASEKTYIG